MSEAKERYKMDGLIMDATTTYSRKFQRIRKDFLETFLGITYLHKGHLLSKTSLGLSTQNFSDVHFPIDFVHVKYEYFRGSCFYTGSQYFANLAFALLFLWLIVEVIRS